MIQRKIMKAQTFVHQSVARVFNAGRSRTLTETQKVSRFSLNNPIMRRPLQFLDSPVVLFAREILSNPRSVGAACPSSRQLAKAVADVVPLTTTQGLVVELGAGTGIVTDALLKSGLTPERLVAIERSVTLADYLRRRFPASQVIAGDALYLSELLGDNGHIVDAIILSLPFRTLPTKTVQGVVEQIDNLLKTGGHLIQFTYDLSGKSPYLPTYFKQVFSKIVWNNLPPARINVYQPERKFV